MFVSAYGPETEHSEDVRQSVWMELAECVASLKLRNKVIVLGDLNAKVCVIRKWSV